MVGEKEDTLMPTITSKDGTPIAFDRSGQGPALVLVSGGASTRADAAAVVAALAPHFTVYAYDRRGRGDSGDTLPYAVAREIEDLAALISAAGGSTLVFGHSSGAVLALEAALALPTHITRLAVYEPPFIIDTSRPPAPPHFAEQLAGLIAAGRRGDAVEAFMANVGVPPQGIAQMRQSPAWPGMERLAPTLVYDMTIVTDTETGDPAALKKYAAVTVPTLVMDGTLFMGQAAAHAFMRHGADELARVLPNAQRRTLEGQDHNAAPDVLCAALAAFLLG
jgi:pimeloyl-ACP methyl ester carboxylesterase